VEVRRETGEDMGQVLPLVERRYHDTDPRANLGRSRRVSTPVGPAQRSTAHGAATAHERQAHLWALSAIDRDSRSHTSVSMRSAAANSNRPVGPEPFN
jgi:hypothetical protein